MLILTVQTLSRSRALICPSFLLLLRPYNTASAAVTPPPIYPSFSNAVIGFGRDWNLRQVVSPFKSWFKSAKNPLLDRIFEILSSRDTEDLSSVQSADLALAQLRFRLSESFVLEVLGYGSDVLSCMKFFDWAGRQPGFNHTRATFHAIFKILSRAKLIPLLLDFLGAYGDRTYAYTSRFYDTLVIGYAVAGKPDHALQLLGRMRFQGLDLHPIPYNVLLNALIEKGYFEAGSSLLCQIKMRGYENEFTHSLVIKSFCKRNLFDQAENYLLELASTGQTIGGGSLKFLVDALCKSGRFECAASLIHQFMELGSAPMSQAYGVWIRGLVKAGKSDVALDFLKERKADEGYIPEVFRCNMLLFQLLRENRLKEVLDLLMDMRDFQVVPDAVTMNAVMCFFCKAGLIDVALEFYHARSEYGLTPNSMVYTYLVNSLCGYGDVDEAFDIFMSAVEQGKFCGKNTFSIVADALCRKADFDKMMQLLIIAANRNFKPSNDFYNKLIFALCRAQRFEDAYLLHGKLNQFNGVTNHKTYDYMVSGFCQANRGDIAARLMVEMQENGHAASRGRFLNVVQCLFNMENAEQMFFHLLDVQLAQNEPNGFNYNIFIHAAAHVKRPDLAGQVYEMMKRNGVAPNRNSDIFMLMSYLKAEKVADALNFFQEVCERRLVGRKFCNTMVVGLCKSKRADCALEIMRDVRSKGLVPSLQCYEELVLLLCGEGQYDKAIQLLNEMVRDGRPLSSFVGNIFLLHSLRSRDLYEAWIRSRNFSHQTPVARMLNELIAKFSFLRKSFSCAEDVESAIQQCFPLDLYTYNLLIRRFSIDQIDEAFGVFSKMCRKGFEPNKWTYDALVHGLLRHGRRVEAMEWLEEMFRLGFDPNPSTKALL